MIRHVRPRFACLACESVFLVNGYKELFLDLSEMMRSFTSVYQLLPIYAAVKVGEAYTGWRDLPGVDRVRAEAALRHALRAGSRSGARPTQ